MSMRDLDLVDVDSVNEDRRRRGAFNMATCFVGLLGALLTWLGGLVGRVSWAALGSFAWRPAMDLSTRWGIPSDIPNPP